MIFARVGVIMLPSVRSLATGKIIRAPCMNKVDLVKVRVWDIRLECTIGTNLKY